MLYIRKTLSKKEKQEYKEWLNKNKSKKSLTKYQEKLNQDRIKNSLNDPRFRALPSNVSQTTFTERLKTIKPESVKNVKKYIDPEMEKREMLAQKEIEHKKSRIAPHYNKGPYQFITDEIDLKTLGKKV